MSYYFRVHINTILRKDTPKTVVTFLATLINSDITIPPNLDDPENFAHPFFNTERWISLFHKHHALEELNTPIFIRHPGGYYDLQLDADINYGREEIRQFVDWISPYVAGRKKKQFIGWYKGESSEIPQINLYVERV